MARPKAKAPARRYHLSGQSVVTIAGRDYYLGKHDSPESIARYAVLIGIYQQNGLSLPEGFDVADLDERAGIMLIASPVTAAAQQSKQPVLVRHVTASFREHIAEKYRNTPQEKRRHERLCKQLDERYGDVPAVDFGPVKLKAFREWLVGQKLARKYVNRLTNCVVAMFRHAVADELIDVAKVQQLETLEPLRYGQTTAPEKDRVEPAVLADVRLTAEHLSPIIKSMVRVQIATGMRPKELCSMRPRDIDRTGEVWIYRPASHKTTWRGKDKAIPLLGDARDAITEFLQRNPEAYCFSPAEAMAWRHAVAAAKRVTPKNQGNRVGTNRKSNPKRKPRDKYDSASYRQAIKRAAEAAGVPHWFPYRLRHLTATEVRAVLGIEQAQSLLGHSTAAQTAHYARESINAAIEAAKAAPKL